MQKKPLKRNKEDKLGDFLVKFAEKYLTRRAKKHFIQAEKRKINGFLLDSLYSIVWAIFWVFIINQFFLQAYIIPSGSMIPKLLIGDRIFVNKLVYGPEILPDIGKFPSPFTPERADIVIFQSPEYTSEGPVFSILHRVIYMATLSLIDIDPSVQLLIKRAIGHDGDQIIMRNGDFYIKARGEKDFIKESEFIKISGLNYQPRRLLKEEDYDYAQNFSRSLAYEQSGNPLPSYYNLPTDETKAKNFDQMNYNRVCYDSEVYYQALTYYQLYPWNKEYRANFYRHYLGIYVPDDYFLPLGDNRDDSKDGRYWGIIAKSKTLGKALFRFFPIDKRFGVL